jgi:hypothetical protein
MYAMNAHLKPNAVLDAEKETAAPADLISLPAVSNARGSGGVEGGAEIGVRPHLREFDYLTESVLHDEPGWLIRDEKRIWL